MAVRSPPFRLHPAASCGASQACYLVFGWGGLGGVRPRSPQMEVVDTLCTERENIGLVQSREEGRALRFGSPWPRVDVRVGHVWVCISDLFLNFYFRT